jgi:hypothetical protein
VQQDGGEIDNINTATGSSTVLYTATGFNWNGAAWDQQNGLLYIDDIGESGFTANQVITNTIYSFNPATPTAGVSEVGTISGQFAFTGAGFHNGLYYTIGSGSDDLLTYNLAGHTGSGNIALNSSQILGGLGTGITGVSLGDLDFVGNTLYVSAGTLTGTNSGATVSTDYTLYKYTTVGNTGPTGLAANYPTTEGTTSVGVGIAYDFNSGKLIMFNTNINNAAGTISQVNQNNGAQTGSIQLLGPAGSGGPGDFAIVPEPSTYAFWSMMFVFALVFSHRILRPREDDSDGPDDSSAIKADDDI